MHENDAAAPHPHEKKYEFFVDGTHYQSDTASLTGAQIKARVASIQPGDQLVEEGREGKPDRVIPDDETVDLNVAPPLKFYIVPPATFGS